MQTEIKAKQPVLDFRTLLNLEDDDILDGYKLTLGGFIHINNLEKVEQAYLAADAAGLHAGAVVQFKFSKQIAVVIGRNLTVMTNIGNPAECPVVLKSQRGTFEYDIGSASPVQGPIYVEALTRDSDVVEGMLTQAKVDEEKQAHVEIGGRWYAMRDFALLEVAPTKH